MPKQEVMSYLDWKRTHPKKQKVEKPKLHEILPAHKKIPRSFNGYPISPNRLKQYGLTLKDYDRMDYEQDGTCAICLNDGARLVIDHHHESGNVRALLCSSCNSLLGFAQDDIRILLRAIDYLNHHSRKQVSRSQHGKIRHSK